jgi:hypothetical protein
MVWRGASTVVDWYNGLRSRAAGKRAGSRSDACHSAGVHGAWGESQGEAGVICVVDAQAGMNKSIRVWCGSLCGGCEGAGPAGGCWEGAGRRGPRLFRTIAPVREHHTQGNCTVDTAAKDPTSLVAGRSWSLRSLDRLVARLPACSNLVPVVVVVVDSDDSSWCSPTRSHTDTHTCTHTHASHMALRCLLNFFYTVCSEP